MSNAANRAPKAWKMGARDFALDPETVPENPFNEEREPLKFAAYADGYQTARMVALERGAL